MSTGITTQQPNQGNQLAKDSNIPAHLIREPGQKAKGLSLLQQYVIPPRLKIVQGQSKPELKKDFPEGSVICQPQRMLVAGMPFDEATRRFMENSLPFTFTPLFFFPEYFCFNPYALSNLPAIRDRSTDPKSDIARKAKRKEWREEICPESPPDKKLMMKYRESLTCVIHITDVEALWGIPVTMSFMGGEFGTGQRFLGDIGLRKADIFGNVFQAYTAIRHKDNNSWYGYNCVSPPPGTVSQWVEDTAIFKWYEEEHDKYAEAYQNNLLMSEVDDDDLRPQGANNVVDANKPAEY